MDNRIYVRFKGKTLGPLTAEKVQGLIARGQITRMHELSSDGLSWVPAESFGNFFARSHTNAQVSQAATVADSPQPTPSQVVRDDRQNAPESSPTSSTPRPGQPAEEAIQWYAHINGDSSGPFPTSRILGLISTGQITASTLVWRSGFDDWKPAAESFPDNFVSSQKPTNFALPNATDPNQNNPNVFVSTIRDNPAGAACEIASRSRPWVIYLAVSCLIYGGITFLFSIGLLLMNARDGLLEFDRVNNTVSGIVGLVQAAVVLECSILLWRYGSALSSVRHGSATSLAQAMQHLSRFWKFIGIVTIVAHVLIIGGIILFLLLFVILASNGTT